MSIISARKSIFAKRMEYPTGYSILAGPGPFLAQRVGFEPMWDCSQTDFEKWNPNGIYGKIMEFAGR